VQAPMKMHPHSLIPTALRFHIVQADGVTFYVLLATTPDGGWEPIIAVECTE